jgi:ribose transport system ATP-binding protein
MKIVTPSIQQQVMYLSGGNQQKVVVAKMAVFEFGDHNSDEPTRGIDVGAKLEIYELINRLAEQGKVNIVVSSDMEEIHWNQTAS